MHEEKPTLASETIPKTMEQLALVSAIWEAQTRRMGEHADRLSIQRNLESESGLTINDQDLRAKLIELKRLGLITYATESPLLIYLTDKGKSLLPREQQSFYDSTS
jgi:hypothetical protein